MMKKAMKSTQNMGKCLKRNVFLFSRSPFYRLSARNTARRPHRLPCSTWCQGIGVIPKSSHRERIVENLDIFDVTLTPDDMARIQQLETGKTLFGWYED